MTTFDTRAIGDAISVRRAAANTAATAGGTGDATAVTGVIIDRAAIGWARSAVVAIPFTTTLAASQTLTIAWTLQDGAAPGLGDAATFATASSVVATGSGTFTGQLEANVDLSGARRYVRLNFTPDLSASGTDTAALSAVLVFGGADRLPQ